MVALTENVVSELRVLQAKRFELGLGLGTQGVRAVGPEVGDRGANGGVALDGVGVDVSGVGDLALGRGVDAVDLGAGKVLERGDLKLLRQGVHASMLQELFATLVHLRDRGVGLERSLSGDLLGEVVASVEELEEAADTVNVFGGELDLAWLRIQNILACIQLYWFKRLWFDGAWRGASTGEDSWQCEQLGQDYLRCHRR